MYRKRTLTILVALIAIFALSTQLGLALPGDSIHVEPENLGFPMTAFTYQGYLEANNSAHTGACDFQFSLWNAAADGQQIGESLFRENQQVSEGYFDMQLDFGEQAFRGVERWLKIQMRCPASAGSWTGLVGRQAITPVPHAIYANTAPWTGLLYMPPDFVDGVDDDTTYDAGSGLSLDAGVFSMNENWLDERYLHAPANVVIVAKQGGQFDKIQAAVDNINDAAPKRPYLVYVAPGWYEETVVLKPHITLQGAGERSTFIYSAASNETLNPNSATLRLAGHSSVFDLTVLNGGEGKYNVALLANPSLEDVVIRNVTVKASGEGERNYGIYLIGGNDIQMEEVSASAAYGSEANYGMQNGAGVVIQGGRFDGQGGLDAYGINSHGDIIATNTDVEGHGGTSENVGLRLSNGGSATLEGGTYTGDRGNQANGIRLLDQDTELIARNVFVEGKRAYLGTSTGLSCANRAFALLQGGTYVGRRGERTVGIDIEQCTIEATDVEATGESGFINNYGLKNDSGSVRLSGGIMAARCASVQSSHAVGGPGPGPSATGIDNYSSEAVIEANDVIVIGELSDLDTGINNHGGSIQLTQGTITGRDTTVFGYGGKVTLAHTRLQGSKVMSGNGGIINCILVSRGSDISMDGTTCP